MAEEEEIVAFIENKTSQFASLRATLLNQIATLTAYRKSLIHECVTGQRRIIEADLKQVKAMAKKKKAAGVERFNSTSRITSSASIRYGVLEQSDITDTEHFIAEDHLWAFLKATQGDTLKKLTDDYGTDARDEVFKALRKELDAHAALDAAAPRPQGARAWSSGFSIPSRAPPRAPP